MKLAANFHLAEFEHSNTAARLGINNKIPDTLMANVKRLAGVMQNIRDHFGSPVIISSGYRCQQLNRAVRGSTGSQHLWAAACDFIVPAFGSPYDVCKSLERDLHKHGIRQLIHEFGEWVHIGVLPVAEINRVLTIDSGGTRTGIHLSRA